MAILKKEYELSLWNEELNSSGIKTEKKGMIIGAHDMEYLGRATDIKLKREIKGTNTLTFQMPSKFFDPEKGDYVKNEFVDYIFNEAKIKLFYNNKWIEFYVKKISEAKQFKSIMYSYECRDSFIDELSRTGYEIAFDTELYNNVDEITPFMEVILEDSIWDYTPEHNTGDFTEFKEERFYKIPLSQFGGMLYGYPINLQVAATDFNSESDYCKSLGRKITDDDLLISNVYTGETRQLEYGDDCAHIKELFWDPYKNDNGRAIYDKSNKVSIQGDYIYVPQSDLSYIYGSVYEDAYKSTEEPAIYGSYRGEQNNLYALQPTSKDPSDFIQFIYFSDGDKIIVDEAGTVANNDCHYVITIEEWNNILHSILGSKTELVHWSAPNDNENNTLYLTAYETKTNADGTVRYTTNVMPDTLTIDDFTWYPVYYDGYLDYINDIDVFAARKISITDRTEFNLKSESYTTIYNNNAKDYKGIYSEEETETILQNQDLRVQSIEDSRIVVPTLARNLITNGLNITTEDGWEPLTQSNQTEYNTGSYANLLEISIKSTTQDNENYEPNGEEIDEGISDYYLELLSPNIEKCDDFSLEGMICSDYALNFGLTNLENGIEKDKIYAIRICSGSWKTTGFSITYRNPEKTAEEKEYTEEERDTYSNALKTYCEALLNNPLEDLTIENSKEDFQNLITKWINEHDSAAANDLAKWINVAIVEEDFKYLVNRIYKALPTEEDKEPEIPEEYQVELKENEYEAWVDSYTFENQIFSKTFNQDLNKILIGQGSIDIDGNYTIAMNENGKCINFSDLFTQIDDGGKNIHFVEHDTAATKNELFDTIYHNKVNNQWQWGVAASGESVEDNAYLLFKAKENISSPYFGLYVSSDPLQAEINNTTVKTYAETNFTGVKMEAFGVNEEDGKKYLVDNAVYKVYIADDTNFSTDFLNRIGVSTSTSTDKEEDKTEDDENTETEDTEAASMLAQTESDDTNEESDGEAEDTPVVEAEGFDLGDGDLLGEAKTTWTGISSSSLPLFFKSLTDNPSGTGSNTYVLFINDLYYGILKLDKIAKEETGEEDSEGGEADKEEDKEEDSTKESNEEVK